MKTTQRVPEILQIPPVFNMGFHYTQQYSRRSRVKVMGLVDQASPEWERWYLESHSYEACQAIADAGYTLIEVHFLYGFGLESEKEEFELTKKMVQNAHRAGLKVLGYFQFFSIQSETFFVENPWAKACVQINEEGKNHQYNYNRDALCFSHEKVRQYYLDGIRLGLEYCGLDGIRLDNSYNKTCYCEACQALFQAYLKKHYPKEKALHVFGIYPLTECRLVPKHLPTDPLYQAMTHFGIDHLNGMMKQLYHHVKEIRPDAVFGGNPAVFRSPPEICLKNHVYVPELGACYDILCSENSLFPARTGDSIRHQAWAYKNGQSNTFKVYGCHHQKKNGRLIWPENSTQCALSMFEGLAFGGHVPVTVWGIRMDNDEFNTLYRRPEFLEATEDVAAFIASDGELFRGLVSDATLGVYQNRNSLATDYEHSWYALHGVFQILLKNHQAFRLVDTDDQAKLSGLKTLIVPDIRMVSDRMVSEFLSLAKQGVQLLLTGESCRYDEFMLKRESEELALLLAHPCVTVWDDAKERCVEQRVDLMHSEGPVFPYPEGAADVLNFIEQHTAIDYAVTAPPFVAVDTFENSHGQRVITVLNYDNANCADVDVKLPVDAKDIHVHAPKRFGCETSAVEANVVKLSQLSTLSIITFKTGPRG